MANEVEIIITAVDKASRELKKVDGGLQGLAKGALVAGGVLVTAGKVMKDLTDGAAEYAAQVRELTQITGLSADETSRIIQVADDWGISIEQVTTALGMMTKNGVTPSIDALAALADEYQTTTDKTGFAEKASKLLGRQWQTLVPLLAKGGDALRDQAAAVDDSLIVTDKAIKQAREYEIALDDWNDSVLALKLSIGRELMPAMSDFFNLLSSPSADSAASFINEVFKGTFLESEYSKAIRANEELAAAVDATARKEEVLAGAMDGTADSTLLSKEAISLLDEELRSAAIDEFWMDAAAAGQSMDEIAEGAEAAAPEIDKAADAAARLNEVLQSDPSSPLEAFIEDIEWYLSGGSKINEAFEALKGALAAGLDPAVAKALADELYIASQDMQVELDKIDADTAAENISTTLGVSIEDAKKMIDGTDSIQSALAKVESIDHKLKFSFIYSGTPPPGWTGGTGGSGGDGAPTVPGEPGWGGGGGSGPQSVTPGTSGMQSNVTIFVDGSADPASTAAATVAALQNASYSSVRAGIAFSGA